MARNGRSSGYYQVSITKKLAPAISDILQKCGELDAAASVRNILTTNYTDEVSIDPSGWSNSTIESVISVIHGRNTVAQELKSYLALRAGKAGKTKAELRLLPEAMKRYLAEDVIDGWIYQDQGDGTYLAYVVGDMSYHEKHEDKNYVRRWAQLEAKANRTVSNRHSERFEHIKTITLTWDVSDVAKKTVAECLFTEGYLKETPDLKSTYLAQLALFNQYQPQRNHQFLCSGTVLDISDSYWSSTGKTTLPPRQKMVNDEALCYRRITPNCSNYGFTNVGITTEDHAFSTIPLHPYILMFDLTRHENCFVHVDNMEEYVYDETLRDKLVLPDSHRDLIDILTSDLAVFSGDIIEGKSGGTAILCYGQPGLGKTLTAEVYSEIVKKPLYKVSAGQLGTTSAEVEKELSTILKRGERWGAVMLIDEADVYIRARGNDMEHNAVVACFLRVLEYFNGLLFLTTNRANDVDDAIISRMIAMFKYELPSPNESIQLWRILGKHFQIDMPESLAKRMTAEFPKLSGRDIKQLIKLVKKYCDVKQEKMTMEVFRICAVFRGMK